MESKLNELEKKLAVLEVSFEALLISHQNLVRKLLGDTPETAEFLGEIEVYAVENFPEIAK